MWLLKQLLAKPVVAAVKLRGTLASSTNFYHKGAIKSYSYIVELFFKPYVTDESMAKLDAEVRNLIQASKTPAEYGQNCKK